MVVFSAQKVDLYTRAPGGGGIIMIAIITPWNLQSGTLKADLPAQPSGCRLCPGSETPLFFKWL